MTVGQGNVVDATDAFAQQQLQQHLQAAIQGNVQAYQHIYQKYVGQVYALSLRLTGDAALAEDATQEVFVQVWQKLENFSHKSQFSTWLHSVTANVTISYMRKQRGWFHRMFGLESANEQQITASESLDLSQLDKCILKLPERARQVFVLHAIEGYRHEDIADMLNMAAGTSKAQFHRARQLLQEWLGDDDQ
ncbi:RNA polymerase sigma factor [Aestuariibacter sp. GS-14]|uniref:RNA polymerase sigma factor n=1 Tax=Aestuariibacter sp. GS-14 TaxID=2590670 RepID=UPI00112886BD|nr:RNA polymerase sigma factor [Aestuariibacter sp. GS-14]TPV54565.1 RNA polymerase sigma factor [Aestuariibacter sp. GS-14]